MSAEGAVGRSGEFVLQFRYALVSRQLYDWLRETPAETLTDIQRAARFYYLHRLSFGTKRVGISFGTSTTSKPKINLLRLEEDISEIHQRLASVVIEQLPWAACLAKYDREHTLFFVDPPYWKLEGYATPPHDLRAYEKLASELLCLKGRAILTINRHPEMERIFRPMLHEVVDIAYTVGRKRCKSQEMICCSWPARGSSRARGGHYARGVGARSNIAG